MQPINKNERRKAFWNFLVLFIISILIITTTVFFSIQVPFKQNEQLLNEKNAAEKEREFSTKFMNGTAAISAMLDTINTKASRPEFLEGEIQRSINDLNAMVDTDSGYNKTFYKNILVTLDDLKRSKKQLRDLIAKDLNVGDCQKTNEELNKTLDDARKTIEEQLKTIHEMQQRPQQ